MKNHNYHVKVQWTGNEGFGTKSYKSYNRNHEIVIDEKYDTIKGSSDPSFMGEPTRYNPEELFLSSLSSCHMLWYLHLCSANKISVMAYEDMATGTMEEMENGSGKFVEVLLAPSVIITDINHLSKALDLHKQANEMCFIANSCNFEVKHTPTIRIV